MENPAIEDEVIPEYGHRMSTWPVFWGVIAIIFGVVGFLIQAAQAIQAGAMVMMPRDVFQQAQEAQLGATGLPKDAQMEKMMEAQSDMMSSMIDMAPLSLASAIALSIVALVLIVGGIMLCARKRIASPTLQTWAYLKIIAGGFAAWVGYKSSVGMFGGYGELMNSSSGAAPPTGLANMGNIMEYMALIWVVVGILWMLLLPVFFLGWFNRPAVKEDMKHGQGW